MLIFISLIIACIIANYTLSLIGVYLEYRYFEHDGDRIPTEAALSIGFLYFACVVGFLIYNKIKDFSIIKKKWIR